MLINGSKMDHFCIVFVRTKTAVKIPKIGAIRNQFVSFAPKIFLHFMPDTIDQPWQFDFRMRQNKRFFILITRIGLMDIRHLVDVMCY
jgi:hypothetical protein